jgi:diguanylate cyclase (GGDEF)-like protein
MQAIYRHLIGTSLWRGVAEIAATSVAASVVVTWATVTVLTPWATLHDWLWTSMLVPAVVSSVVGLVILSLIHQLEAARSSLAQAASTDLLTGVGNRRRFFEIARHELAVSRRHERPVSIVVLDLDHFKTINDRFGHAVGDEVLVQVARTCSETLRDSDLFCRWGGEEFIALLPATDASAARLAADRLRRAVAQLYTADIMPNPSMRVTISLGVATSDPGWSLDRMIMDADTQLYRAKAEGRNCVMPQPSLERPEIAIAKSAAA